MIQWEGGQIQWLLCTIIGNLVTASIAEEISVGVVDWLGETGGAGGV